MNSYLHSEKMSNLDLHPLSLSIGRLSPTKSTSSIDQYTHRHSKGDSAYSSFSGSSTVPEYPSHFLTEDVHPTGLHYADLKYVKGVYGPSVLESDSKSMPQLYQSMEVITQHQNHNESYIKNSSVPTTLLTPPPPPPPPPMPPVRFKSFMTNKKSETLGLGPDGQHADISTFSFQVSETEVMGPKHAHGYRNSYQINGGNHDLSDDKVSKPESILSRLTSQRRNSRPNNKDLQSEIVTNVLHSGYEVIDSDSQHALNSWHMDQNMISGSIQHKGQFYFVTGVYKSCESSDPKPSQSCKLDENHRFHSEHFESVQLKQPSTSDGPHGNHFFQDKNAPKDDQELPQNIFVNNFGKLVKASPSVYDLKDDQQALNRDLGRHHTTSNPIFYCGPETSFSTSLNPLKKTINHSVVNKEQNMYHRQDEDVHKLTRQLLADVPTEKISKETTPLLYHLTGASMAPLMYKAATVDQSASLRIKDTQKAENSVSIGDSQHSEVSKKETPNDFYLCNTLDDSFKKYYKEKLKDAQTKVLRETSFKRKDLQLSGPVRIEQFSDESLSVKPTVPRVQDLLSKLEKPVQHYIPPFQDKGKEYIQNPNQEIKKRAEKDLEKQQNFAQPQVPRVASRKRLTLKQKLYRSEPEKLHELVHGPTHIACRSLGCENEQSLEYNHGEQELVSTGLKLSETRRRAMSASFLSKNTLKHLQQKALLAYLEHKTGNKVAEPQQPALHVANKLTAGGRHLVSAPYVGSQKELFRPLSAGRIQDFIRNDQFTSAYHSGHLYQSSCNRRSVQPGQSASAEILLDEQEHPNTFRSRSTSTPAFHPILKQLTSSTVNDQDTSQPQFKMEEPPAVSREYAASVPDQLRVRVVASRGKSMEELGTSKVWNIKVHSKSSEQLPQLLDKHIRSDKKKSDLVQKQENSQRKFVQHYALLDGSEQNTDNVNPAYLFSEPSSHHTSTVPHPGLGTPPGLERSVVYNQCHQSNVNGEKIKDMATHSSSRETSDSSLAFSQIKAVPQEKYEVSHDDSQVQGSNSDQEVILSPGVTTDPSLWPSPLKNKECTASQSTTTAQAQSTQPHACDEKGTIPNHSAYDSASQSPLKKIEVNTPGEQPHWESLVQEVVLEDQSLARLLYPITDRKTAVMLMEQLLSEDMLLMQEHYKKKEEHTAPIPAQTTSSLSAKDDNHPMTTQQHGLSNTRVHVTEKKKWLIAHIEQQLKSLEGLRSSLQGEEKENGIRGDTVEARVRDCCLPAELKRYKQFIEDLERVISLLLCLSARLARVQNALSTVDENTECEEKQSLDNRHQLLCKQREDAKDLKDNLDRRERVVSTFLAKQLSQEQLQEYRRFVQIKASLLICQKDLDEKQRLWEEQLTALLNSISP